MKYKAHAKQIKVSFLLSLCVITLCSLLDSLALLAIYTIVTVIYFHSLIIRNKIMIYEYLLYNCLLLFIGVIISYICLWIFHQGNPFIIITGVLQQVFLILSSVYLKTHFHL